MRDFQLSQVKAPLYEALQAYKRRRVLSFDVPGHKKGPGNPELVEFLGADTVAVDANSMKMLDNLIHPVSVIKEAEELAADAFGAEAAYFIVNGTSAAVQAMILATVNPGEQIIMPRNVHRSAINALILARATPIYVDPGMNDELGIPLAMSLKELEAAILANPEAKAVLINNPTYYGVCARLAEMVELAHRHGLKVLVDEAHGTHFYFSDDLPPGGLEVGADLAAVSLHKTGGSLTQSSLLLAGEGMRDDLGYLRQIINLTQTTSASYLLMSSLDISRRNLALRGEETFRKLLEYARYARSEINKIGGYLAFGKEFCDEDAFYDFDETKLSIHTRAMGLAGIEVYDLLRDEYEIQAEFGDLGNVLAILSIGDRPMAVERLIAALSDIRRRYGSDPEGLLSSEYLEPKVLLSPAEAFYAKCEQLPLASCLGRIAAEFVMCYPPGIPILAPGEELTPEILEYISYAKTKGASMTGTEDLDLNLLNVVKE
ncbi:MAG: aminotransferase class I/II-fold pyridoxal phosphate-dependent enzyme [Eubacteriales bacterium]|nr:aminotransferase class I/II-fold pyridoxal phosphate-dependent enzyme [Eubacteriales bacterium]